MKGLDLSKIFDSMKENEISELIIKEGSRVTEIRRGGFKQNIIASSQTAAPQAVAGMAPQATVVPPVMSAPQAAPTAAPAEKKAAAPAAESNDNLYELKSPLVGTYYGAPKPDAPPFVKVGDKVKKGQTVCIVEAMKNFNEIESEVDGIVREVCAENTDLVEFGKVLFRIEK